MSEQHEPQLDPSDLVLVQEIERPKVKSDVEKLVDENAILSFILTFSICVKIILDWAKDQKTRQYERPITEREKALLTIFADATMPAGDVPGLPPERQIGAATSFNGQKRAIEHISTLPPTQRTLLRLLVIFAELYPVIFGPVHNLTSHLNTVDQQQAMDGWAKKNDNLRHLLGAMRAIEVMSILSTPEAKRAMGQVESLDPFKLGPNSDNPTKAS